MAIKGRKKSSFGGKKVSQSPDQKIEVYLERGTLEDMRRAKAMMDAFLKYQWDFYSHLAQQRHQVYPDLLKCLQANTIKTHKFEGMQRAVKYKYGLHPLSAVGSLSFCGQRFNYGSHLNTNLAPFSCLYIAQDKDTALQETLGQSSDKDGLTPLELALTSKNSTTIVSVTGQLDEVFDLRDKNNLKDFLKLIKGFSIDDNIKRQAKELKITPAPTLATSVTELAKSILDPDWRRPAVDDIPANCQIFGQMVMQAGIQGIIYPSQFTKKDCIAIFPKNFDQSNSWIQLDDEPPHEKVPKRLDSSNWRLSDLTSKEVIGH